MGTLFWALFGLPDISIVSLGGVNHQFTETVGQLLYGVYHIIAIVVLLNVLIAMMSNTYTRVEVGMGNGLFVLVSIPTCQTNTTEWPILFVVPTLTTPTPHALAPAITRSPLEIKHHRLTNRVMHLSMATVASIRYYLGQGLQSSSIGFIAAQHCCTHRPGKMRNPDRSIIILFTHITDLYWFSFVRCLSL